MGVIRCKKCREPISVRTHSFGYRITKELRSRMKPITESSMDKQLCAECEAKR